MKRSILLLVMILACADHESSEQSNLALGSGSGSGSGSSSDAGMGSDAASGSDASPDAAVDAAVVDATTPPSPVFTLNMSTVSDSAFCDSTSARCDGPDIVCSVPSACVGSCSSTWTGSFGDTSTCFDDGFGNWTCPGVITGCAAAMLGSGMFAPADDPIEFETVTMKKITVKNTTKNAMDVNILKADVKLIQKIAGGAPIGADDKQLKTDISIPANDSKPLEDVKVLKVKGKDLYVVPLIGPGDIRFKQVKVDAKAGTMEMEAGPP
jgi:hypothetical protein